MRTGLIVGAGIGGLAAGIALRRAGWRVRIFERAPAPRAVGFGLALAPNAAAALRALGAADAILAQSTTPTAGEVRRCSGQVLRRFVAQRADLPPGDLMRIVLRPALHAVLLDVLGPSVVETGRTAVSFNAEGGGVRLQFSGGDAADGDVLIGADGVGSIIRAALHPEEPPARASGYFALRGVSPAVDRLDGLHGLWYFDRGLEAGVAQASADAIYWFVSLRSEAVRDGSSDLDSVFARTIARFDPQFRAIVGATAPADRRLDELLVRDPLPRWGAGPVTLLGDAAHPMLPHTGQGAAQALEDAVALGAALDEATDPVAALRGYEDVRAPRTTRVVRLGPRIARVTTTTNPVIATMRDAVVRLMPESAIIKAFTQAGAQPSGR